MERRKQRTTPKGKFFHCGEKGHWKRNCPKFLAAKNKGMIRSFLLEIFLVQNPTDSWFVNSGCTNYICNVLQGFQETRRLNEGKMFLTWLMGAKFQL